TIGQDVHKKAQSNIGFLFVIPGCAGAFRTEKFKENIKFEHDTLTEDLDFTYKFHSKYCKIVMEKDAIVYTQDPFTLSSYINQLRRWYSGGWQNLKKHISSIVSRPLITMELSLIYFEGFIFSILLFILPFINFRFFLIYIVSNFIFVLILGIYASMRRKRLDLLLYSPLYLIMIFVNAIVFIEQFFSEIVLGKKIDIWFKPERIKQNIIKQ
ncbi:MAG: glycosyltransferase family 2 protein, partial [Minisyncoccia bacterium]